MIVSLESAVIFIPAVDAPLAIRSISRCNRTASPNDGATRGAFVEVASEGRIERSHIAGGAMQTGARVVIGHDDGFDVRVRPAAAGQHQLGGLDVAVGGRAGDQHVAVGSVDLPPEVTRARQPATVEDGGHRPTVQGRGHRHLIGRGGPDRCAVQQR